MLRITFSNRFEILLDQLIDRLAQEHAGPFVAPQIIVPSTAIERRVRLALADRHGICANVEFSYLAQWLWRQIRCLVEDVREDSPFAPEVLTWRVYEALGDSGFIGEHERLRAYLANADEVMRLDLAQRVAQLIEQYITYRPRFLQNWSAGKRAPIKNLAGAAAQDEAWQAALWRRLAQEIGTAREHPSVAFFRRIEKMSEKDARSAGLPQSAHVFCLPAMPPLYLEILRGLARWTDLRLYVMNPCREYWFEVVDRKRLTWLSAAGKAAHHESGNNLLASWGKQTQAHIDLLLSGEGELEESTAFQPDASGTLLAQVHNSILDLEELPAGSVSLAKNDRSIEVHVCHSLTRELEVLHDQLLMMFAAPNPPAPGEIVVVTPNLNDAAPFIDAVFGTAPEGRRIPYSITGQSERRINGIAHALDSLIALTIGRHPASAVFDLLMQAPVAARFALDTEALDSIRTWIEESGIRWGLESAERKDFKLPATADHTFDDGLQRLYLGYAIGEADAHIDGRIGAGNAEGQRAAALGTLWRFVEELRQLRREWLRRRNAQSWRDALNGALARFVAERPEWSEDFRAVQIAISQLHDRMERGGLKAAVPLEVVRAALAGLLDDPGRGGVPGGRVTFSSMSSLRSLPYRVVCAIGMNDGVYPTAGRPLEFDLVALSPQRGDRQRRLDERNVFLDLLLSARERLYLSYTGRSVRDNSRKPPSVLVAEVLDYAVRACSADAASESGARKRLVIEHPLQPFSAEYFVASDDARRRSFNTEYCEALTQKDKSSAPATLRIKAEDDDENETAPDIGLPLFQPPLPPPGAEWRTVRLEKLCNFFQSPSRYLLRDRLGIALGEREEDLADDEPFLPDANSRRAIGKRLLDAALEGVTEDVLLELARAGNEFPAGPLGEAVLRGEVGTLWRYARGIRDERSSALVPHAAELAFSINGEEWRLTGTLGDLHANGLVRHRYDDVRSIDYLAGWIDHLFLCASAPAGAACRTRWHSRDGIYVLEPYPDAKERLAELMALYREGLQRPLHFFPRSSWTYVVEGGKLNEARNTWFSYWRPVFAESQYPAYRLALRGVQDPLDDSFTELANRILVPLRRHVTDPRL